MDRARRWQHRVLRARRKQVERNPDRVTNHRLEGQALHDLVQLDREGQSLLERSLDRFGFSARTHTRILRMARTLADMQDRDQVLTEDIAGAIALRRAGSMVSSPAEDGTSDIALFGG